MNGSWNGGSSCILKSVRACRAGELKPAGHTWSDFSLKVSSPSTTTNDRPSLFGVGVELFSDSGTHRYSMDAYLLISAHVVTDAVAYVRLC